MPKKDFHNASYYRSLTYYQRRRKTFWLRTPIHLSFLTLLRRLVSSNGEASLLEKITLSSSLRALGDWLCSLELHNSGSGVRSTEARETIGLQKEYSIFQRKISLTTSRRREVKEWTDSFTGWQIIFFKTGFNCQTLSQNTSKEQGWLSISSLENWMLRFRAIPLSQARKGIFSELR